MAHVGYARVSTLDQDPALQLDALAAAGCAKVFEDRASGIRTDRTGLQAALDYVRDGDVLVTWKLDRLGRSLPHLIETVTALERRGVGFRSLTEAIDTQGQRMKLHFRALRCRRCVCGMERRSQWATNPKTTKGRRVLSPMARQGAKPRAWPNQRTKLRKGAKRR